MRGRKINNAYRIKDQPGISSFFPYLSRTRAESVIYFSKKLDVTDTLAFINEKKRQGEKISLFNLIVASLAKASYQKPVMNRFILGRRLYQKELFDVSYVVIQNTDGDVKEILLTVPIEKDATITEISSLMAEKQDESRAKEENGLDKLMNVFVKFPRGILRIVFLLLRIFDFYGIVPAFIRNELPFYCTIFISNLASIGVDAPFHHLYEFGTTSVFLAFGKPYHQTKANRKGEIEVRKFINMNFTVDERIGGGYDLARAFDMVIDYLENPEKLYE